MAEVGKKHPPLPPNYVTLAQLQERWINKQREKEEEERKQREKDEENRIRKGERRINHRNRRNQLEKRPQKVAMTAEESKIGEINIEEDAKEKEKRNKKKKKKSTNWKEIRSKAQKAPTEGTVRAQSPPPVAGEEKTEGQFPPNGRKMGDKERVTSDLRALAMGGRVWERKGLVNGSAGNGGSEQQYQGMNGNGGHGHRKFNRGFGGFGGYGGRMVKDGRLVWVKKGDIASNANAAQSSGSLVEAGKGKNARTPNH